MIAKYEFTVFAVWPAVTRMLIDPLSPGAMLVCIPGLSTAGRRSAVIAIRFLFFYMIKSEAQEEDQVNDHDCCIGAWDEFECEILDLFFFVTLLESGFSKTTCDSSP
ncbi:hypothetical protein DKX38_024046 [Salix brachista]|uniref:Uncharacterized protein n=1 Tax=Salix brachista TaxID=2182728 RepID=A0A5N5JY01_9ROSI|nr:hypothetical protein DKX38_024046 [Salix brachista]